MTSTRTAGAFDTSRDRGIERQTFQGDVISAFEAHTVFAVGDTLERSVYLVSLVIPATFLCRSHCLDLHRIKAGQSPDALLVEFHGLA